MYFKSLELIGFKSFADKTRLNFEPGVTAIVGPNGCGKSNIADAIRWVLGEQSTKSLRASKMEDVIFNGTDSKDPINFAEVSLILSNEKRILPIDYDEVIITRRVFRSGDTEYLLNKTPVRLKDIAELLMGTGIGTESYSIIEQGKMDLILSSRPEDRRYVFEEASGITKYKSKKKEALRKLEQTEQNLLRINDIILEVKRQIGSIERQARKAERYKADFDQLKEIEVNLSYIEFRDLRTGEKTRGVESGDLRERERELGAELASFSSKISDYRQSADELAQRIAGSRERQGSLSGSFDMNSHKIRIDAERIEEARVSARALEKEMALLGEKMASSAELAGKLKAGLERIAAERTAKQKAVEEKESFLEDIAREITSNEEKVKAHKTNVITHLAKETRIKNELIKIGADVQNKKARQRRLQIEKETVEKDLGAGRAALASVRHEFGLSEKRLSALRSDLAAKRDADEALLAELKTVEEGIIQGEQRKAAVKSKIEFLEDIVKRFEGFTSGVKSLLLKMGEGNSFRGILAVLADIITVEDGCEEAVHTFLGDDTQLVITERDDDIQGAIEYLNDKRLGKASFVSLEMLGRIQRKPREAVSGLVPLKRFVRADRKYEAVIDHLFDNAYLVESLDDGLKGLALAKAATLVTRSGLMFSERRISGGRMSENEGSLLIGRRNRLEGLERELAELERNVAVFCSRRAEKAGASAALKREVSSLEDAAHAEDITLANIKMKRDSHEEAAGKFEEELSVAALEMEEVGQAIAELAAKGEALNGELNVIETEKSEAQLRADELQALAVARRAEREGLTLEIASLRAEHQSFGREEENARNNAAKEESLLAETRESLSSKRGLTDELARKTLSLEAEMADLAAQNEQIAASLKGLAEEVSGVEKAKSDVVDKMSIEEIQLKEKEKEIESLRNQVRDLDVKLTEINYKKTNLRDRIQQAYKVDLENVHMEAEEASDPDAARTQVAELKERLEKLGPVNLVAIDEHKELEERRAFLTHQQEDLVNAKESLLKAIQKINKTTKELFIDAFVKIQLEFKNFFRLLFGGGQAELVLIDEQDVLESGIEIIVRPPGKKLQNITLLSGGEKALTAIALLFSIFKVKPSPFCVLDEIDAPLDEANILRFSNVLKEFIKISQFIIITHNKRTIELADVMYGITMQERGVSKIVSVKFMDETRVESEKVETAAA